VAVWEGVRFHEALLAGQQIFPVSQVPLAYDSSRIAFFLKEFSNGSFSGMQTPVFMGMDVSGDADARRVASREEGGAGRHANRGCRIEVRETHPLSCHTVQMRGGNVSGPVATQIAVPKVVAKNKDDVRGERGQDRCTP
jgi:hypothetical protein